MPRESSRPRHQPISQRARRETVQVRQSLPLPECHSVTPNLLLLRAGEEKCSRARMRSPLVNARSEDRKSTRLNSSHLGISYAVFCLKKKKKIVVKQTYKKKTIKESHNGINHYIT